MAEADIFDAHKCLLGEGPLWHPERKELLWFDILGKELRSKARVYPFEEYVSAAGWVDHDTLLVASASALFRFDLGTGWRENLAPLEADNPLTRSNDGRADPWGGFWIGTMGINSEPDLGAIYRYYRGEVVKLYGGITISNSICFAPDRSVAYWVDTEAAKLMRQPLEPEHGWPEGPATVLVDATQEAFGIDGSVCDADGNIWNAQWGASRIAVYSPRGEMLNAFHVPGKQSSCSAFGGPDLTTLYVTTAAEGLDGDAEGRTYEIKGAGRGLPEYQVIL
ncbi:MAG: SMP-30/gluconolactonase/LRE family protein [Pseudomonadota bacterium]